MFCLCTIFWNLIDSPKHQGKPSGKNGRGTQVLFAPAKPVKGRNIVIVSQKSLVDGADEDSDILNLQVLLM